MRPPEIRPIAQRAHEARRDAELQAELRERRLHLVLLVLYGFVLGAGAAVITLGIGL